MDLETLANAIGNKSSDEFNEWLTVNEIELSNFVYRLSGAELYDLNFDKFFFGVITISESYSRFEASQELDKPFERFMEMIAVAAERLALIGIRSMLNNLLAVLPDNASRRRLEALNEFANVEDVLSDYFSKLPKVLGLLMDAQLLDQHHNLRSTVDIILFFFKKAKDSFDNLNLDRQYQKLMELCNEAAMIASYPLLEHPIIQSILNGEDIFAIQTVDVFRDRLEPTKLIRELFESINNEYYSNPNIDHPAQRWWGYDIATILDGVLKRGRTDFREGYGPITPAEKVLLYCFFNMKKHFYTSYAVFEIILPSLEKFFSLKDYKPIMIDLGCGPMTSGIALADLINTITGNRASLTYVGVDHATEMLNRAKSFRELDIFTECNFFFCESFTEVDYGTLYNVSGTSNPVIFNASYLFASETLKVEEVVELVSNFAKLFEKVYFVFQNPDRSIRNVKYKEFKSMVHHHSLLEDIEIIRYRTISGESSERVKYEILQIICP